MYNVCQESCHCYSSTTRLGRDLAVLFQVWDLGVRASSLHWAATWAAGAHLERRAFLCVVSEAFRWQCASFDWTVLREISQIRPGQKSFCSNAPWWDGLCLRAEAAGGVSLQSCCWSCSSISSKNFTEKEACLYHISGLTMTAGTSQSHEHSLHCANFYQYFFTGMRRVFFYFLSNKSNHNNNKKNKNPKVSAMLWCCMRTFLNSWNCLPNRKTISYPVPTPPGALRRHCLCLLERPHLVESVPAKPSLSSSFFFSFLFFSFFFFNL